jgi:hypothetical protein
MVLNDTRSTRSPDEKKPQEVLASCGRLEKSARKLLGLTISLVPADYFFLLTAILAGAYFQSDEQTQ